MDKKLREAFTRDEINTSAPISTPFPEDTA